MPWSSTTSRGLLALALLSAACRDRPAAESTTDVDASTGTSTGDASTGEELPMLPPRPGVQTCRFDGQAPGIQPPLELVPLFPDAALVEVVDVAPADPDGRVIVGERGGRILTGDVDEGALAPVVDIGERGRLVALATGPEFAATGHLFVRYEANTGVPRTVVARLTVDLATWTADLASERVVLEIADAVGERSGGALVFDAAGMLVIGVGDLGGGALSGAATDPTSWVGKLLRVDVGPIDDDFNYGIPVDNPFIGLGGDADEVWAIGLRDPWRCTVADEGSLWCVDVGEFEQEVDRVTAGADLGWPRVEGSACLLPGGDCSDLNATGPAATYRDDDGDCGIAGALFGISPGLDTSLVYADRCSGRLRGVDTEDPEFVVQEDILGEEPEGVVALARDGRGEPIAITGDARLARLVVAPPPGQFPARLSDSGCFTDLAALAPVPGVVPYGVNAELWTDGASKSRHIALPPGAAITIGEDGSFAFPTGSVLLKTFAFEFAAGGSTVLRPVETRVMVRREYGWQFHSYRWNEGGSDAELLVGGDMATIAVEEHDATVDLEYTWPSRGNCKLCHGFGASNVLGPRLEQLNGDYDYGDARANQLRVLAGLDMFAGPLPGAPAELPRIPSPEDRDATVEQRARAYLHTHCGHCHRPGGWTPPALTMDLRWSTPFSDTHTCGVDTQYVNPWVTGEQRIAPGDPESSAIWQRLSRRGPGQMPPLGTTRTDARADAVHEFIAQLQSCP